MNTEQLGYQASIDLIKKMDELEEYYENIAPWFVGDSLLDYYQRWLLEVFDVGVYAMVVTSGEFVYEVWKRKSGDHWDIIERKIGHNSYQHALDMGLFAGVEFILSKLK